MIREKSLVKHRNTDWWLNNWKCIIIVMGMVAAMVNIGSITTITLIIMLRLIICDLFLFCNNCYFF
jgi:hypothetical protein